MIQYNVLNATFSNLHFNKFKSGIKNDTKVTLNLSSNVSDDSNHEANFPHKFFLTNTQVSKIRKAFANGSSTNEKLSKTQLFEMVQLKF